MPVISVTQETEMEGRFLDRGEPGQKVIETPYQAIAECGGMCLSS
jgi:hypothetical protein